MLVKPDLTEQERINLARQLLRVLDSRGLLIEFENIPANPAYEDSLSGLHQYILLPSLPEIYLEKQGNLWLFSQASVEAIPDIYRSTFSIFVDLVLDNLPDYMHHSWFGLAMWQYLALFFWLLAGLALRKIVEFVLENYVHRLTRQTNTQWDDYLVESVKKPVSFIIMLIFFKITATNLMLSVNVNYYMNWFIDIALSFSFVWLFYGLVNVITGFLGDVTSRSKSKLDEQLVPLLGKTLRAFVVIVGVLFIIQNSGYNVASVLAGLGIGGLAVALAARDTLANFFGSVTIFLDILRVAKDVGVEFAYPTQTLHIDSFHADNPRSAGEKRSEEELVSSVWEYGPQGSAKPKGGARLFRGGKEIDF
ncbi:MAG: MscS family mechanosensitve ion channel [Bacteroidetes bacterium HLUCCA01]|nr:MAG: MscS family mechanosensitve ion channel [Bacteroidetes bacterium HLUCCA01]